MRELDTPTPVADMRRILTKEFRVKARSAVARNNLKGRGASALFTLCLLASTAMAPAPPNYEVYAIKYGAIPFRVAGLIAGADTARRIDIAMMVWLIKGNGRNVLVDAGFYRDKF